MDAGRMVGGFNKTRLRHITILAAHPPSDITFCSFFVYSLLLPKRPGEQPL